MTASSSATGTSAAASSVIFTPSSMAQETAGQRATRSLSYSITSVSSASAAAVPAAPSSTASILTLFDPSAVSPDLSSASNTHASSASFRFSSSASPAHGHPARPFSPLTSNPAAAQAAAAAAVAAGPLALAPAPVPAVSPVLRKSFATGATATMSSIRQKIREQISGMRKEKGRRDQEDVVREWSTCLAKWNQYQPAVSGAAASLNGSGLSQKDLASNQKKLSGMLLSSGIPSHMRASVWLLMIGNGLGLTPQSFEALRASCAEKRKEYEAWRKQTNSNHLNAKHRHLAEAEAAAAAAAAAAVTAASSSGAEAVPAAANSDPTASPASSSSAFLPTFHPSPSPSPSSSASSTAAAAGSATPQSVASTLSSFDSGTDASLDPSCAMFSLIDQDLPRTFPELAFFHHDGPYEEPLRVVLEATAAFRAARERERIQALALQEMGDPSLVPGSAPAPVFESSSASSSGYVQGMSFLASILFLALGDDDPFLAFVALTNLLENPAEPLSQLFSMRLEIMEDWLLRFDAQFLTSLPKLHAHFSHSIGLSTDMFLYKWIFSVYAQSLHLDAVFRVWDCFLWESFKNRGPGAAGVASAGAGNAAAAATSLGAGNAVASKSVPTTAGISPASPTSATSVASASSPTAAAAAASTAASSSAAPAVVSASSALHVHSGHGFPFLFRVALGILSMFSDALCSVGFEECLHFLHHLPGKAHSGCQSGGGAGGADEMLDIDLLFQHVRTIKMETSIWGAGMASK